MTTIDEYLKEVAQTAPLTQEEEQELLAVVQRKGTDCEEMGRLEKALSWLVASLLPQYQGAGQTNEELVEAGNEGLQNAVLQYRPEYGEYFFRFAVPYIREKMQK